MRKSFVLLSLLVLLASCGESGTTPSESLSSEANPKDKEEVFNPIDLDTLRGVYFGKFDNGMIHIILSYANPNKVIGYNIHRGLQRNLSGDLKEHADYIELTLNEPGDHPYDGVFTVRIDKSDFSMNGEWVANDTKIGRKPISLQKRRPAKKGEEEMEKPHAEEITITEDNFINTFEQSGSEDGDFDFSEDGLVVFHWQPRDPEGRHTKQEKTIKGNWSFSGKKTISVDWEPNTYFKKQSNYFEIIYLPESGYPALRIEGKDIFPMYY
jgi:hypothetical protein